jgi:Peptidase A4 family
MRIRSVGSLRLAALKSLVVAACLLATTSGAAAASQNAPDAADPGQAPQAAAAPVRPVGALAPLPCGDGLWLERPGAPVGFDPLAATEAQLRAVDFPPRPSEPASLAVWHRFAARYRAGQIEQGSACQLTKVPGRSHGLIAGGQATATPEVIPPQGGGTSPNWAGFVNNHYGYTDSEAEWVVPGAVGPAGYRAYSNAWVGVSLGGSLQNPDYTHPIVQAGSESDYYSSPALPFAWFEVWPEISSEIKVTDMVGIGGHLLMAHVHFATDGHMSFHIVDLSSGIDHTFSKYYGGTYPDGHAEFIVERPVVSGILPALADFQLVTFQRAQSAAPSTGWKGVGNLPNYYIGMYDSAGYVMAWPGAVDSTGYSFHVRWYRAT